MVGYPCLPLALMLSICKSIISWLENDPNNVAVIHCQQTKGRSALIVSCLLCVYKVFTHPSEALIHFCKKTHTDENKIFFPSQHLYMKYFANLLIDRIKLGTNAITIKKIIFSEIPKVDTKPSAKGADEGDFVFKPYLQIFKGQNIIYNSLAVDNVLCYFNTDISVWFEPNTEMAGDILIRCKHFHSAQERFPVFRIMINTGFVFDNIVRYYKRDVDFSPGVSVSDQFFIDIIFTVVQDTSGASDVNLNQLVKQLDEQNEEIEKAKAESTICLLYTSPSPRDQA
eukprot:TRINITY_DN12438_c0_g1_i15.p1 TRINITY_DN12438_c0_g1~~TRINITY_DN12438_c0_g1_i15.p1  ORF type:complete len:284 (-),score=46.56 TRINITY_DN12438_c0_g1_i15:67-918(-)